MNNKLSRLEVSKLARRILAKHRVDLEYCQYTCFGREVTLTGWLQKVGGADFNVSQIEAMLMDFPRYIPGMSLRGDLDNWSFSSNSITSFASQAKEEKKESEELLAEVHVIELEED